LIVVSAPPARSAIRLPKLSKIGQFVGRRRHTSPVHPVENIGLRAASDAASPLPSHSWFDVLGPDRQVEPGTEHADFE